MHGTNNRMSTRKAPLPPGITTSAPIAPIALPQHPVDDKERYPLAVFGKLPAGFNLNDQPLSMLIYWHRKAMRAVDSLPVGRDDAELTASMAIANEIFEAIKLVDAKSPGMVSDQMLAVVERLRFMKNDNAIEEELDVAEFIRLAEALVKPTAMPAVTKHVGALQRGRKLILNQGAKSAPMPGFIKPQLATLKSRAPKGDQWLHEIKFDGYRVQIHINAGRKKVFTRNGLDWTKRFSQIAG